MTGSVFHYTTSGGRPYTVRLPTADARARVIRNVPGHGLSGRSAGDERLSALPFRSPLPINGLVWTGELAPHIDAAITALEPTFAAPGLSLGHELSAEQLAKQPGLLGRTWAGDLTRNLAGRIRDAAAATDPGPEDVDAGEIYEAVESVQRSLETRPMNFGAAQDAFRRVKRARDAIEQKMRKRAGDARHHPGLAPRRTVGDFGKRLSADQVNDRNERFWREQERPTRDSRSSADVTAMRDAVADAHRAQKAGDTRAMMDAINRANAACHARHVPYRGRRWGAR